MTAADQPTPEAQPAGLTAAQAIASYNRMARGYDLWASLLEERAQRRALELAAVQDGDRVLEVGVGTGAAFVRLLRGNEHGSTVGVDASAAMLARCRRRAERCGAPQALLRADARHLPLPEAAFDLVFSAYLLDLLSLEGMRVTIDQFRRALRPAGRAVLVSMTYGGRLMTLWSWLYKRSPGLLGGCRSISSVSLLEEAGFVDIQREVITQLGFPSEIVTGIAPEG